MRKFCTNCGVERTDERFCPNCGYDFWSDLPPKEPAVQPIAENLRPIINSSGTRTFSLISLVFGVIPLIILGMLFIPIPGVEIVTDLIGYSAILIFAFGLYQFVTELPTQKKSEGKLITWIFVFYGVINIVYDFIMMNFVPEIPENPTLETLQNIIIILIVMIALGIAVEAIILIGSLKFTSWFNNLLFQLKIPESTSRLKWYALLGFTSMVFMFIAMSIIFFSLTAQSQTILETAYLFLSLSSILVLVQVIMQFLAGYKIYKIVNSFMLQQY